MEFKDIRFNKFHNYKKKYTTHRAPLLIIEIHINRSALTFGKYYGKMLRIVIHNFYSRVFNVRITVKLWVI